MALALPWVGNIKDFNKTYSILLEFLFKCSPHGIGLLQWYLQAILGLEPKVEYLSGENKELT